MHHVKALIVIGQGGFPLPIGYASPHALCL